MKKKRIPVWSVVIAWVLIFGTLSPSAVCGQDGSHPEESSVRVVTTFYPIYIMALNVIKDTPGISVRNLTPPVTGCLHDYSLTAADMKEISKADIFFTNGAGMESFIDKVGEQYPRLKIVKLADGISLISNGMVSNPHVWVSVSGAVREVRNLGAAMEQWDPVHAELYGQHTAEYLLKLETLRSQMESALAPYRGTKVVMFHEAFSYFAQEFGLDIVAVVEREPGSSPSAKELAETIKLVKMNGVKALFGEPQYPLAAAETIARETGAKVYTLDPAVTGPDDPDAYIHIMEKNLKTLEKALTKSSGLKK